MEQNQKQSKILEDCATIAENLKLNPYVNTTQIKLHIKGSQFLEILSEIEDYVRIKVDRNQNKLSIDINDVEFIFIKD
jgi:helix-turn-helix protein|tara:strand:+ start:11363 stop:11596 length:234 start_codon:yes stop_codon:yes gene_type:complete